MADKARRALSLGLRRDQLCCLFFRDRDLVDWQSSRKGASSPKAAVSILKTWLSTYQPDCVIIENPNKAGRKGAAKQAILRTLGRAIETAGILKLEATRKRDYANIYEEAAELAKRFPQLAPWVPKKPPIWQPEPRNAALFEALSLGVNTLGI